MKPERTDQLDEPANEGSALSSDHEVAEYALLGLLREGPRHGYRLAAEFNAAGRLGVILRLKMGQMYAYLRKLERQRLLTAHDEPGQGAGRTRRVFALTPAGQRIFDTWLAAPVAATRDLRLAFLIKLAFTLDEPATALALLDRQRAATSVWLERLRASASEGRGPEGGRARPSGGWRCAGASCKLRRRWRGWTRLARSRSAWATQHSRRP
jgi:DNA-binding PadR family transcriptional regulator